MLFLCVKDSLPRRLTPVVKILSCKGFIQEHILFGTPRNGSLYSWGWVSLQKPMETTMLSYHVVNYEFGCEILAKFINDEVGKVCGEM